MRFGNTASNIDTLAVEKLKSDAVVIRSHSKTDEREVLLLPGDVFGGHAYAEWLQIASEAGRVPCDWLDV